MRSHMWAMGCLGLVVAVGCDESTERPPPPAVAPAVAVHDAGDDARDAADAGPTDAGLAASPDEEDDEPEEVGLPVDPFERDSVDGAALKQLIIRDPDRAAEMLQNLTTPDPWQVALLAQLAIKRSEPGPDAVPESPMPDVLPRGAPFALSADPDAGVATAYVASALVPLKASPKGATVVMLPINTAVTVSRVDNGWAKVSVALASQVRFGRTGTTPTVVTSTSKTGVVEAKWLVAQPVDPAELTSWAASKKGSDLADDEAVVLLHRAFLISRTEAARRALVDAAWQARRATWVVTAALNHTLVAPHRIDVAYACVGNPATAKWLSLAKGKVPAKLPDAVCVTDVDVRKPCSEKRQGPWRKRIDALEQAGLKPGAVTQFVVDATRPRMLWFYDAAVHPKDECGDHEVLELDASHLHIRRLLLPLGTTKTVVNVESAAYVGTEFGVVAAASEAKARSWLRRRTATGWTFDEATHELNELLGVDDANYRAEHHVVAATVATLPDHDCAQSCANDETP